MTTFVNPDSFELPAITGPFEASKPGYMKLMAGEDGHLYFIDEAAGATRVTLVGPESLALQKFEAALSDAESGELLSIDVDGNPVFNTLFGGSILASLTNAFGNASPGQLLSVVDDVDVEFVNNSPGFIVYPSDTWATPANVFTDIAAQQPQLIPTVDYFVTILATTPGSFKMAKWELHNTTAVALIGLLDFAIGSPVLISVIALNEE